MWLQTLKRKYKWVLLPSGTLHWLRLGPSCQQNLNQASKTDFNKEVELQQNNEMNRDTKFPMNQTMSEPLQLKSWCGEFPSAFLWTRNPPGQPQWTLRCFTKNILFWLFILHKVVFWSWGQYELMSENVFQFHSVFLPAQLDPDKCKWAQMGEKWFRWNAFKNCKYFKHYNESIIMAHIKMLLLPDSRS